MAEFDMDFNPADVPPDDRSFDPVPAGNYDMQVIDSEIKPTKSGDGQQLVLTLEIINGPMTNRRIWDRLNIRNQNADAQRIAQRALADLCLAIGIPVLRNTEELHFKPFVGKVGIRADKTGQYGPGNTVRYKPRNGAPAPASVATRNGAAAAGAQQPPQRAAAGAARPWAR